MPPVLARISYGLIRNAEQFSTLVPDKDLSLKGTEPFNFISCQAGRESSLIKLHRYTVSYRKQEMRSVRPIYKKNPDYRCSGKVPKAKASDASDDCSQKIKHDVWQHVT
jgi:hypothetical protein